MISNVAVIVFDDVSPFELGVACEAWGRDRSDHGIPVMDFAVCSPGGRAVRTISGFGLNVSHGLDRVAEADLVILPAMYCSTAIPTEVIEVLHAASERAARIMSICSGAFVLGEAGLLDGRRCTTHWMHTSELAEQFPAAEVVPEVLYVEDGPILTSAGTAAGLDASLHLWRQEFGSAVANTVARRMVVPTQRQGGQAQFIKDPVPECQSDTLEPLISWIVENLDESLDVDTLARRVAMSPRTFARRFRDETGTTPHAWITARRVHRAEQLLEETELSIERIAGEVGFGNAATLRQHFSRLRRISPQQYRRRFSVTS